MDGNVNGAGLNGAANRLNPQNDAVAPSVEAPTGTVQEKKPLRLKNSVKRLQAQRFATSVLKHCDICFEPLTNRTMRIDHDHETGKARGFLCNSCNTGLGFFEDNQAIFRSAIKYLEKHTPNRGLYGSPIVGLTPSQVRKFARLQVAQRKRKEEEEGILRAPNLLKWHTHPNGRRCRCLPDCPHFAVGVK
jgi:hypothetical protein